MNVAATLKQDRRKGGRRRHVQDVIVKGSTSSVRIGSRKVKSVQAQTQNVSLQGLAIQLSDPEAVWSTGANVKIQLKIQGRSLELPARICWARNNEIGVRLFLELMDQASRTSYLHWLAD